MKQLTEEQIEKLKEIKEEILQMREEFESIKIGTTIVTNRIECEYEKIKSIVKPIEECIKQLEFMDNMLLEILSFNGQEVEFCISQNCLEVLANFSYEISKLNMNYNIDKQYIRKLKNYLIFVSQI